MAELHEVLSRKEVLEGLRKYDTRPLHRALSGAGRYAYGVDALAKAWEPLLKEFPGLAGQAARYGAARVLGVHRAVRGLAEGEREALMHALGSDATVGFKERQRHLEAYYGSLENARPRLERLQRSLANLYERIDRGFKRRHGAGASEEERALFRELAENHANGFMPPLGMLDFLLSRTRGKA